jgi:putative ABC transport system permease protein
VQLGSAPVRALWLKAPFVLRAHPALLASVVSATALAALAAASWPLVRAGVESQSLQGQLRTMTPLAAGLEIRVGNGDSSGDRARRAAAIRLSFTALGPPVVSSLLPAQLAGPAGAGTEVVALARTGALAHVRHETPSGGPGVWIADSTARAAHLRPGSTLRLTEPAFLQRPRIVTLRVAGIYRSLEAEPGNPYWANWLQDIRSPDPDSPPPPPFVLMTASDFERTAGVLGRAVENRFEFPIDPTGLTLVRAKHVDERLRSLAADVEHGGPVARPLGCAPGTCTTNSALSSALIVASSDVAAVMPTISLLSACGVLIALAISLSVGGFLVRRRADEAQALFARGESALVFAGRVGIEGLLPGLGGLALGLGGALLALRISAPTSAADGTTVSSAVVRAAIAVAASLGAIAAGAAAALPRDADRRPLVRRMARLPWEVVPLIAAGAVLAVVLDGRGLVGQADGATHPRLAVFLLPLLAVPGAAGLAARIARRTIHGRGRTTPMPVFLALRRLAAARWLLVTVVAASATAYGTFAYSSVLSASLSRSTAEKAWVSNGSDVQGLVDTHTTVPASFPFPVALVQIDSVNVALASGMRVDLVSGDPRALARTLRWGRGWSRDPRRLLPRLSMPLGSPLAAIATPGAPDEHAIVDQGVRLPIRIVGRAAVPGASAGRPALLVSRVDLRRLARRAHILDPAPQVQAFVWAKGPPAKVEPALARSELAPVFLTTADHIFQNASVRAAARSYRFVKVVGIAAAGLSVLCLLLYLQARQRSQLVAAAVLRRMGLGRPADGGALALEAAAIVLSAGIIGGAVAVFCAGPIVRHVDSLPQYAPGPVVVVPWVVLGTWLLAATIVTAALGAAASGLARRADVAGALRVA